MATTVFTCFSLCISLLVAPSGLECILACQGKVSLHYAAIYELIFELPSARAIDGKSLRIYGLQRQHDRYAELYLKRQWSERVKVSDGQTCSLTRPDASSQGWMIMSENG